MKVQDVTGKVLPNAKRGGTRGYRAPEVLLKSLKQGCALDIWSAGIILISILTRRLRFFESQTDFHCLAEIVHIVGVQSIRKAALRLNRRFSVKRYNAMHYLVSLNFFDIAFL